MISKVLQRKYLFWMISIFVVTLHVSLPARATDSIPTTEKLDLGKVSFEIDAQPEFKDQLHLLALKQLKDAGLFLLEPERAREKSAVLKLMLKPESLHERCPGKVLYEPSLTLNEDVIVPRTGETIKDSTWSSRQAPQVRKAPTLEELEKDLEGFVSRFIVNYKMGNRTAFVQKKSSESGVPSRPSEENILLEGERHQPTELSSARASLKGLNAEAVNFVLWAGVDSKVLNSRAVALASKNGLKLAFRLKADPLQTLTLKLDPESLDEACPGKVFYEASLELVEQVKIKRNPNVYIWTSTWSKRKVQIADRVSKSQLEADIDDFLGQFLASYKSDNKTEPSEKNK